MNSRKIVAVFETRDAAETARDSLLDLGVDGDQISVVDQSSSHRTANTPAGHGSFWAHVKEMFMPDEDRSTIDESLRRGGFVLIATADDARADEAIARLERAGAIDLKEREAQWRAGGWSGSAPVPHAANTRASDVRAPAADTRDLDVDAPSANTRGLDAGAPAASPGTLSDTARAPTIEGRDTADRIPVLEERLRIGKREVNRGSVRVRSYIVEEPVHEEVRLRDERVDIERRPVNAPGRPAVAGSPGDLFQERTIEVSESAEQAVVGKEARVTEEVVVSKTAGEHVESIDDTVRHTRVEVEDNRDLEGAREAATDRDLETPRRGPSAATDRNRDLETPRRGPVASNDPQRPGRG
jgi:uncharacterized protein (TIGR02271 family)